MERIYKSYQLKTAADTDGTVHIAPPRASQKWALRAASIVPNATTASNGTNYVSLRGYYDVGTSNPIVAARDTSATALTVGVPEPLALTATQGQLECTQAEPLHWDATHPGTGAAVDVTLECEFEALS